MPPDVDPRLEHRVAMRERVLAAVAGVAASRGIDKLSFAEVAAEAGLARSVVYNYFPDKESLLIAHADQEIQRFLAGLTEALRDTAPATERVRLYVRTQLQDFVDHPQPAGHEVAAILSPEGYERMHAHVCPLDELLTGIVAGGVASGEFLPCDPRTVAALINACLGAERHPLGQGHHDLDETIDRVTTFVLRGLGARQPPRSP